MITKDEYFKHLLAHYRGLRHPEDVDPRQRMFVRGPFAKSMVFYAINQDYEDFNVAEIDACQYLFKSCVEGDLGGFTTTLDELTPRHALLLQPVTILTGTEGQDETFKLCPSLALNAGIDIQSAVYRIIFKCPSTLDFLLGLNWEHIQNKPKALNYFTTECLIRGEGHKLEVLR